MENTELVDASSIFQSLVKEYFDWVVREHPISATYLGIHDYDDRLGDYSKSHIEENIRSLKQFSRRLKQIRPASLPLDLSVDYRVLQTALDVEIFETSEIRSYETDPDYVSLVASAVYPLFTREFAPAAIRFKNISSRIRGTSTLLEQARENVKRPVKVLCEVALEAVPRNVGFLKMVGDQGRQFVDASMANTLSEAVSEASQVIHDYEAHVKRITPSATTKFAMGPAKLRRLVALRRLPFSMEAMLRLGRRVLRDKQREMDKIAKQVKSGASWQEANQELKKSYPPNFETAYDDYLGIIENARKFIVERGLASLPSDDSLKLVETPQFMRHVLPTAAYIQPAPFDKDQTGQFLVTPVEDKLVMLREHTHGSVVTTVVHEAYPGHHLQLAWSNKNPSLVRKLFYDAAHGEGWAHYCEELMIAENDFEDSPAVRFMFLNDAVWRAARVIVDIGLHTGKMGFEEAVQFFMEATGMEEERARREIKRYVSSPGQPLSYLVGKEAIKAIKKRFKKKLGRRFDEKRFHNALMQAGKVTFPELERILRKDLLGKSTN